MRFSDARGDCANACRTDKLHTDPRPRVNLLEIVDQLGQIFDRVNVVMRWW